MKVAAGLPFCPILIAIGPPRLITGVSGGNTRSAIYGPIPHRRPVRDKSVAAMPAPLGEIHHWLHDEIVWLHIKWADFCRCRAKAPFF